MLSKSLITLYINICKITKLILVTQHTYKYANIYICKLNAIGIRTHSINMHIYVVQVTNTLSLIIVTTSGIRTHSINMHIYVVQVTYNIIHKYM